MCVSVCVGVCVGVQPPQRRPVCCDCGARCTPTPPGTPQPPEPPYWTLCSLGEGEAGRLASENPEELVGFTKRTLTRVRPSSVRLDSSNPNPQCYWKGGVQLVALNQQTPGAMLDLHRGRFTQNGGCGFVLRPSVMRDEVSYFSAHTQGCVPGKS